MTEKEFRIKLLEAALAKGEVKKIRRLIGLCDKYNLPVLSVWCIFEEMSEGGKQDV